MHFDDLFANHLLFMAAHRGWVKFQDMDIHIEGPLPSLVSFVPGSACSQLPNECPAVRLAPWSEADGWRNRLESAGYHPAESLAYMELGDANKCLSQEKAATVKIATEREGADQFASVQAAGFASGEPEVDDWWGPYFVQQARKNIDHPAQRFYLGFVAGEPATCTLVVRTPGVSGIYAVATRPQHRRRGISMAVLEHVRRDAVASGFPRVILQAMVGSYAEKYYEKLGFLTRYVSDVWRR